MAGESVALLLLLLAAAHAQTCPFFINRTPTIQRTLPNCTRFRESSCCTPAEVQAVLSTLPPVYAGKEEDSDTLACRTMLTDAACYFCDPDSQFFYDVNTGEIRFETQLCESIWKACHHARVGDVRLDDHFNSGEDWCRANGFTPTTNSFSAYQLNASVAASPSLLLLAAASLLTGLFLAQPGGVDEAPPSRQTTTAPPKSGSPPMALFLMALLALVTPAAGQNYCPAFGNRAPAPRRELTVCRGFKPNACCLPEEAEAIVGNVNHFIFAHHQCELALEYLGCWACDPDSQQFYDRLLQRVVVCEETCDAAFALCAGAVYQGRALNQVYNSGREMCEERGFIVRESSDGNCYDLSNFNAASRAGVGSAIAGIVATTAAMLLLSLQGGEGGKAPRRAARRHRVPRWLPVVGLLACLPAVAALTTAEVTTVSNNLGAELDAMVEDLLKFDEMQEALVNTSVSETAVVPDVVIARMRESVGTLFSTKTSQLQALHDVVLANHADAGKAAENPPWYNMDRLPEEPGEFSDLYERYVNFSFSGIKLPAQEMHLHADGFLDDVSTNNPLRMAISRTHDLDVPFKANLASDSNLRWQYFGGADGLFRMYPFNEFQRGPAGMPNDFDPRSRPWYLAASTGPKDVVLVIDCSQSMENWEARARGIAKVIINSWTREDHVGVVCSRASQGYYRSVSTGFGQSFRYTYTSPYVVSCDPDKLVPATPSVKAELLAAIDTISFEGGTDLVWGLEEAREYFANVRPGCSSHVVVLTDSLREDPSVYTITGYSTDDNGNRRPIFEPRNWNQGSTAFDRAYSTAANLWSNYNAPTVAFNMANLDSDDYYNELAAGLGCNTRTRGQMFDIFNATALRTQMGPYFTWLESIAQAQGVKWTAPYVDAAGIGLVVTAALPVYGTDGVLIGVVGIDSTLATLENAVSGAAWGTAYAFLTNGFNEAIVHPLLKASRDVSTDPQYPDISILETADGVPADFALVAEDLKNRIPGDRTFVTQRRVRKGDDDAGFAFIDQTSRYKYDILTGAEDDLMLTIVMAVPDDEQYRVLSEDDTVRRSLFHRLDLYEENFPAVYAGLDVETFGLDHPLYPGLTLASKNSTVFMASTAYCRPDLYSLDLTDGNFLALESFLNDDPRPANPGCTAGTPVVELTVRPDVAVTDSITDEWQGRTASDAIWTYIGMTSGAFRIFPGRRMPHHFIAAQRPWYYRALINLGANAVSAPYLDAFGSGKVVTLAKSLQQPGMPAPSCTGATNLDAGCPCAANADCASEHCFKQQCLSSFVQGVMGVDFSYDFIAGFVRGHFDAALGAAGEAQCDQPYACTFWNARSQSVQGGTCITKCYVIDNAAHLVTDDAFGEAASGDTFAYNDVPLARREGRLMDALIRAGIFTGRVDVNYQGTCPRTPARFNTAANLLNLTAPESQAEALRRERDFFPPWGNSFDCAQDTLDYSVSDTATLPATGTYQGPCTGGTYFLARIPNSNLLSLIIADYYDNTPFYPLGCHVFQYLYSQGGVQALQSPCGADSITEAVTCGAIATPASVCDVEVSGALGLGARWVAFAVVALGALGVQLASAQ